MQYVNLSTTSSCSSDQQTSLNHNEQPSCEQFLHQKTKIMVLEKKKRDGGGGGGGGGEPFIMVVFDHTFH